MQDSFEAHLTRMLGHVRVVRDRTQAHGDARVLELADAAGDRWVAKRHHRGGPWRREVRAYRQWTPSLADRAPTLRRADEPSRSVVLSKLPGRKARNQPAVHREAGRLLRILHASAPTRPYPRYADTAMERLEELLVRGATLFDAYDLDFVRGEIRSLQDLSEPSSVPCHLDYASHNWLFDRAGTVRAIDFTGARRQIWVRDLRRLQFGSWRVRPELREAFLDGYGRCPNEEESQLMLRTGALTAVSRVVWGIEHRLPTVTADGRRVLALLRAQASTPPRR